MSTPALRVRRLEMQPDAVRLHGDGGTLVLRVGEPLTLSVGAQRVCLGYRTAQGHQRNCQQPTSSSSRCPACNAASGALGCQRCTGQRCGSPSRQERCIQPANHAVYLASFGAGLHTVGVAPWEQHQQRLAVGGAQAALLIARADGLAARRIANGLRVGAAVAASISLRDRVIALRQHDEPHELRQALEAHAAVLFAQLGEDCWLTPPKRVELAAPPTVSADTRLVAVRPRLQLSGTLRATHGGLLVFAPPVALRADGLLGYEVQLGTGARPQSSETQLAFSL